MKHFNFYILVLLCCGIYGFAQPSTCTNKGELYLDGSNFVGCTTVNNYNIRPIPEKNPYTALPYTVIEEDGDIQYVPDAGGVLYRQGTDLYKVANEGFAPVTLPYLSSYNYPDRLHELGKIIYYPYDGHFYEGVADGKWVQIDNPIYLEILPENLFLDYPAGNFTYTINSEVNWAIANFNNYPGYTFTPATGTLNGTSVMAYPANTTIANTVRTFRIREVNNMITKDFTVTQYYKPYFAYTNIKDVYGKEQSGTIPSAYQKKVNPGPERFFLWASSNWDFRVRVKYNNAPLPGGYTNTDAVNGDYDYEFQGKGELWAYEYQLKENRTGADRAVGLEISYKRMDGSWDPWEDLNVKNTDNTDITQAYVNSAHYARSIWSQRYLGATQNSGDVGFVDPSSAYNTQQGTEYFYTAVTPAIVNAYSESGTGNEAGKWRIPDANDLQDVKTAGFIPNRPFQINSLTGTLGSGVSNVYPYYTWNVAKTTFLSASQVGYGNSAYLYDKNGTIAWLPSHKSNTITYIPSSEPATTSNYSWFDGGTPGPCDTNTWDRDYRSNTTLSPGSTINRSIISSPNNLTHSVYWTDNSTSYTRVCAQFGPWGECSCTAFVINGGSSNSGSTINKYVYRLVRIE